MIAAARHQSTRAVERIVAAVHAQPDIEPSVRAIGTPRAAGAANPAGRRRNRVIPAAVKRAVWERDAGRCAFVGAEGRCSATGFLEFHHVVPFAAGGATDLANLQLRCRAHNAHEARAYFGAEIGCPNR